MVEAIPYLEFKKIILQTQLLLLNLGYKIEYDKHMNEIFTNKHVGAYFTDDVTIQKIKFTDAKTDAIILPSKAIMEYSNGETKLILEFDTPKLHKHGRLLELIEKIARSNVTDVFYDIIKANIPKDV